MDAFHYALEDLFEKGSEWRDGANNSDCYKPFDQLLMKTWHQAMKAGFFKYTLDECQYKVLPNESVQFVAQLNTQRGFNRRKREPFNSMNAPFAEDQFNFTKIKSNEILFTLRPGANTALSTFDSDFSCRKDHMVVINVSPIDDCHILLIPELNSCVNQTMTITSLLLAFDLVQLSGHPGFRVGFNSLHAWASVNHLHFHAMYFKYPLFLDNLPSTKNVKSNCFSLQKCAMHGFVFNVPPVAKERIEVAKEAIKVVQLLHEKEIPYNVMITRGDPGTRMLIFPRKSTNGRESSFCFDVACVEIGGQLPIKTREEFDELTFDKAYQLLAQESLMDDEFVELVDDIARLL